MATRGRLAHLPRTVAPPSLRHCVGKTCAYRYADPLWARAAPARATDGRPPAVLGIFYDNLSNYAGPTVELHLHHIRHGRSLKCDQAEEGKLLSVQRGSGRNDDAVQIKKIMFSFYTLK